MLIEAPAGSGVPRVTVPAANVELVPPPSGWAGVSRVVPCTVTMHGVVAEPVEAKHVAESLTVTTIELEVLARRSAIPEGVGKVETSMIRNRKRVIGAPVLFT